MNINRQILYSVIALAANGLIWASLMDHAESRVRSAIAESEQSRSAYWSACSWRAIAAANYMAGLRVGFAIGHYRAKHESVDRSPAPDNSKSVIDGVAIRRKKGVA